MYNGDISFKKTSLDVTMQTQEKIIKCYNEIAGQYAAHFAGELSKKHFDRFLLREFASVNQGKGRLADFGCGPGQTTKFLYDLGVTNITGIDLSPNMVQTAQRLFPSISFETGDLLQLPYDPGHFGSAIAFYAIVHFTYDQIRTALGEVHRVLKPKGHFLFSFHIGDEIIHYDTLLGKEVDIDFYFLQTEKIMELLTDTGFQLIDAIERFPYKDAEHPSKRAYIWAEKR